MRVLCNNCVYTDFQIKFGRQYNADKNPRISDADLISHLNEYPHLKDERKEHHKC